MPDVIIGVVENRAWFLGSGLGRLGFDETLFELWTSCPDIELLIENSQQEVIRHGCIDEEKRALEIYIHAHTSILAFYLA